MSVMIFGIVYFKGLWWVVGSYVVYLCLDFVVLIIISMFWRVFRSVICMFIFDVWFIVSFCFCICILIWMK